MPTTGRRYLSSTSRSLASMLGPSSRNMYTPLGSACPLIHGLYGLRARRPIRSGLPSADDPDGDTRPGEMQYTKPEREKPGGCFLRA